MTLDEAINRAAGDLPDGWNVRVEVEKGAAWVEVIDPDGNYFSINEPDASLAEQVMSAVGQAKAKNK